MIWFWLLFEEMLLKRAKGFYKSYGKYVVVVVVRRCLLILSLSLSLLYGLALGDFWRGSSSSSSRGRKTSKLVRAICLKLVKQKKEKNFVCYDFGVRAEPLIINYISPGFSFFFLTIFKLWNNKDEKLPEQVSGIQTNTQKKEKKINN